MRARCIRREDLNHTLESKARTGHHTPSLTCRSSVQPLGGKELSLEQLLQVCLQTGQEVLWTEFVRRSQPVIAGVAAKTIRRWIKPTPYLIDDLVQETYLKLCGNNFRVLRRFVPRHENALHGFLKVVASNTVRDHFRSAGNQKHGGGITEMRFDCSTELHVVNRWSKALECRVLLQAIDKCLETFAESPNSARDRRIFWLYYKHGLTAHAISRLSSIGLSLKGVESALLRMTRLIKLTMKDQRT